MTSWRSRWSTRRTFAATRASVARSPVAGRSGEQLDVGAERAPIVQGAGVPAWTRLREPNQWPASQLGLRPVLLRWQAEATTLLLRVLRAMAPALGQPGNVFRPIYAGDPHQLLKMIRYPGRDATEGVGADCRWSTTEAGRRGADARCVRGEHRRGAGARVERLSPG